MSAFATRRPPSHLPRGAASLQIWVLAAAAAVALAAAGLAWYRVAHTLETARPVKVPTIHPVSGIVWGNRVFNSRPALAAWLHSHGHSYATWASRYPKLARVLEAK